MKRTTAIALVLVACVALVSLTGCYRQELPESQKIHIGDGAATGPATTDSPAIPLDGAESLDATIRMSAGQLTLESGGADALEADFEYRPASLKPTVSYQVEGTPTVGVLIVDQSEFRPSMLGDGMNTWELRLAKDVPLDLRVDLGAGEGDLFFTDLGLRNLEMNMGAGDVTLDFGGDWDHDVNGRVQAGVGQLTLKFPRDVGVRVTGREGGIGEFVADDGFEEDGNAFVNHAYGENTTTIEISVARGIGEVRLETVR